MASSQTAFVTFLIGAAVGAGAMLFVPTAGEKTLRDRVADLESDLTDTKRESADWQRVALAERERKEAAEEEATRLRQVIATAPARPAEAEGGMGGGMGGEGAGHGGMGRSGATDDVLAPEDWDDPRLRMEIQRLSMAGRRMPSSPRLDACVRAARAQGDSAMGLLIDIMRTDGMSADIRRASV